MIGTPDGFAGAGVSGQVVRGWAATRWSGADITAMSSQVSVSLANGLAQPLEQLFIHNGGASAQSISFFQQVAAPARWTPGTSSLRGAIDVAVDADASLVGIRLGILEYGSDNGILFEAQAPSFSDMSVTAPLLPPLAWSGRLRTPILATHALGTSVWLQAEIMVAAGGSATVRFGNGVLMVER